MKSHEKSPKISRRKFYELKENYQTSRAKIREIKSQIATENADFAKNKTDAVQNLRAIQRESTDNKLARTLKKFSGNTLMVDKLIFRGREINFDQKFAINFEKRRVKNGKNVKIENYIVVKIGAEKIEDKMVIARDSAAKEFVNQVKNAAQNHPSAVRKLDAERAEITRRGEIEMKKYKIEIAKITKNHDEKSAKINEKMKISEQNFAKNNEKYFSERSKKRRKNVKICVLIFAILVIFGGIYGAIRTNIETSRNYKIDVAADFSFDCDAKYDKNSDQILCENREISGKFTDYDSVELRGATEISGDDFSRKISDIKVYDYKNEKLPTDEKSIKITENFSIYNTWLEKNVREKTVKIAINYTENDQKFIAKFHDEFRAREKYKFAKNDFDSAKNSATTAIRELKNFTEKTPENNVEKVNEYSAEFAKNNAAIDEKMAALKTKCDAFNDAATEYNSLVSADYGLSAAFAKVENLDCSGDELNALRQDFAKLAQEKISAANAEIAKIAVEKATTDAAKIREQQQTYSAPTQNITTSTSNSMETFANCADLRKKYPHGVGRVGAVDKVSTGKTPVANFMVNDELYNSLGGNFDRDHDGIACEA